MDRTTPIAWGIAAILGTNVAEHCDVNYASLLAQSAEPRAPRHEPQEADLHDDQRLDVVTVETALPPLPPGRGWISAGDQFVADDWWSRWPAVMQSMPMFRPATLLAEAKT
jgi:hypothetical protein